MGRLHAEKTRTKMSASKQKRQHCSQQWVGAKVEERSRSRHGGTRREVLLRTTELKYSRTEISVRSSQWKSLKTNSMGPTQEDEEQEGWAEARAHWHYQLTNLPEAHLSQPVRNHTLVWMWAV